MQRLLRTRGLTVVAKNDLRTTALSKIVGRTEPAQAGSVSTRAAGAYSNSRHTDPNARAAPHH